MTTKGSVFSRRLGVSFQLPLTNSSVPAFLTFLAVQAETFIRLYGTSAPDPMMATKPSKEVLWSAWKPTLQRLLEIDRSAFTNGSYWHTEYVDLWEACGCPAIDAQWQSIVG